MAWGSRISTEWGALSFDANTQGVTALAKDDTIFYGEGEGAAYSDMAVDQSQYDTDLTAAATWLYENSPASRFNVQAPWCIEADFVATTSTTGRIFSYGSSGSSFLGIRIGNSAGVIDAILTVGGVATVLASLTLPDVSGSSQRFVIAWASEANPFTTGTSDAVRSELRAWNVTAGSYDKVEFTHADRTLGTAAVVWWAQTTAGASPFSDDPNACRFSAGRYHTAAETYEDFVTRTTAPTITGAYTIEAPIVEPASDLANPGQFAGPVSAMGAAASAGMAERTWSPLRVIRRPGYDVFTDDLALFPAQWREDIGDAGHQLCGNTVGYRRFAAATTHVVVRVQIDQTLTSTADTLSVRAYSMNRPPNASECVDGDKALRVNYAQANWSASGEGWLTIGPVEVVRNSQGLTWIGLALLVTATAGDDDFEIVAAEFEPLHSV